MRKRTTTTIGLAAALTIAVSGCSSKASDNDAGGGEGDLQTDFGVTDTEIVLGALTDSSGPFKVGGILVTQGNQIWVDEVNAAGGICDRQITLDVRDTGYKADQAIPLYDSLKNDSVALVQIIGSAVFAALKGKMINDGVLGSSPTIASPNLDSDVMVSVGPTFDVEMINAMAFAADQGLIEPGGKVGAIYLQNEAGENSHQGVQAYAEQHDLTLVDAPVSATDTDLTATITKFKSEGVNMVTVAAPPAALGSAAVAMKSQALDVPIVGFNSAFQPSLLANEGVVDALANTYIALPNVPFNSDNAKATEIRETYTAQFQDAPSHSVVTGYLSGVAFGAILEQACEDGDMTREGLKEARTKVTSLDTEGLTGTLDFSDPGDSVTRETIMSKVDATVPGGLVEVSELTAADEVEDFQLPYQE